MPKQGFWGRFAVIAFAGFGVGSEFSHISYTDLLPAGTGGSFLELANRSINQTLSRTPLTAGPTLLACLTLFILGGEVLNGIAFAVFAGIVVGTYSSIFVASALLENWHHRRSLRQQQKVMV